MVLIMILPAPRLSEVRARHLDERIVLGTGCFDLLHRGHLNYIHTLRTLGDVSVVSIVGNRKIRELKGESRPINDAHRRAALLDGMKDIDYVATEPYRPGADRRAFFAVLTALQPDVFLGDETWVNYAEEIADHGVEFRLRRAEKIDSTTHMIERVLSSAQVLSQPA